MSARSSDIERIEDRASVRTASELFVILWETLSDLIGTSATVALLRRSAKRATLRCPPLAELVVGRKGLEYGYVLPRSWEQASEERVDELRELVCELWPLLVELTGLVVVRRLQRTGELVQSHLIPPEDEK